CHRTPSGARLARARFSRHRADRHSRHRARRRPVPELHAAALRALRHALDPAGRLRHHRAAVGLSTAAGRFPHHPSGAGGRQPHLGRDAPALALADHRAAAAHRRHRHLVLRLRRRDARAVGGDHSLHLGDQGDLGADLRSQRERRSRRHLGDRPRHAGDHLRGGDRGQPHPRLWHRAVQNLIMDSELPKVAIAETIAERIAALRPDTLPAAMRAKCENLAIDVVGLCVTARNEDYIKSALAGCDDDGPCTAIGHARTLTAASAAFVNGTACHGEDFDDTFEGGPVHAGAVIVPAVLAALERHKPDGASALLGIAVGTEVMCRLSTVVPKATHKAGFHPTAIFGVMGAAAGVSAALGLSQKQTVDALGIAGSFASGIIEYLAEGTWTKRMHPGWAAQSAIRAALLARGGFTGPRTVFEGVHGLFHAFAHNTKGNYAVLDDFGRTWVTETLAFKPYPCGTMAHPYIDCAKRLAARGIKASDIKEMICEVGEGTVHRLWEPLAAKQRPQNGYAAKFATP